MSADLEERLLQQLEALAHTLHEAGLEKAGVEALAQTLGLWADPIPLPEQEEFSSVSLSTAREIGETMLQHGVNPEQPLKQHLVALVIGSKEWDSMQAGRRKETVLEKLWWLLLGLADERLLIVDAQRKAGESLELAASNVSRAFKTLLACGLIERVAYAASDGAAVWRLTAPPSARRENSI